MTNRYQRIQSNHQSFEAEMAQRRAESEAEERRLRDDISGRTAAQQRAQQLAREAAERQTVLEKQTAYAEGRWQPGQPWPIAEQPSTTPEAQAQASAEIDATAAKRAAETWIASEPRYRVTPKNAALLIQHMVEKGLDPTNPASYA